MTRPLPETPLSNQPSAWKNKTGAAWDIYFIVITLVYLCWRAKTFLGNLISH